MKLILFLLSRIFGDEDRQWRSIPVFTSTNDNYVNMTVVSLTSLLENADLWTFYDIYVMTPREFKAESRGKLESLKKQYRKKNFKICFISVRRQYEKVKKMKMDEMRLPIYYRLGIPGLVPDLKKCIYVDGDTIVRHDLCEMYDIEMYGFYVAGVIDNFVYTEHEAKEKARVLGIPDLSQYICSGVMIMNLENMRKDKIEFKFLNTLKEKRKYLTLPDQDIINSVCYGKILCLPIEFGLMINLRNSSEIYNGCEKKDPLIVHFNSSPKPWRNANSSSFHKEWSEYAKKTSFYIQHRKIDKKGRKNGKILSPRKNKKKQK